MKGNSILIIDEDTKTIRLVSEILESEEFVVFVVTEADSTIPMVERIKPSLILINLKLSDASGLQISKAIHGVDKFKDIPIVLFTLRDEDYNPDYATHYGIVGFIKKPFTPEVLLSRVRDALSAEDFTGINLSEYEDELLSKVNDVFSDTTPEEEVGDKVTELETDEGFEELPEEETGATDESVVPDVTGQESVTGATVEERDIHFEETEQKNLSESKGTTEMRQESAGTEDKPANEGRVVERDKEKRIPRKKYRKRRSLSTKLVMAVIGVVLVIVLSAVYVTLRKDSGPQLPVVVEPEREMSQEKPDVQKTREVREVQEAQEVRDGQPPEKEQQTVSALSETDGQKIPPPTEEESLTGVITGPVYSVQIGAFKNIANAEALKRDFGIKGYETFIYDVKTKDNGTIYKVLIGKFDNRKEAFSVLKSVKAVEKIDALVFTVQQ